MNKRPRYSDGLSHSEKKLKIEMESEDEMTNRFPNFQKYNEERGNGGPALKEGCRRGPGLLGAAPPGYEQIPTRARQPPSSFVPVTTRFKSSPSSYVPSTPRCKSSPSSTFVPSTPRFKPSPSSTFVPSTPRFKSSPSSTHVPSTPRFKSSPSSSSYVPSTPGFKSSPSSSSYVSSTPRFKSSPPPSFVPSTTRTKPFPSTTFVPVQSQNNNLSWDFVSKDNRFTDGDAGFEDAPPWEPQMRELKEYVVKLEDDKRKLSRQVEEFQHQIKRDAEMISSAKKTIELVKEAQECERKKLASMKSSIEKEKLVIDKEKETIYKERQILKLNQQEKEKLDLEITNLRNDMEELNKEKADALKTEEKKHLAFEVKELELRRDLTQKVIEKEQDLEQLQQKIEHLNDENCNLKIQINEKDSQNEKEVSNLKAELEMQGQRHHSEKEALKRKFDSEYEIFSRVKDNFDENMKIGCVFCPGGNVQTISNYLFHVAREHMFDQYKAVDVKEGSAKVGMLLKVLEEKAKREFLNEIDRLNKYIRSLENSARNVSELKTEDYNDLNIKQEQLSKDLASLLEVESNQKQQIEELRNENNILKIQVEKLKTAGEHEMLKKGITDADNGTLKRGIDIANFKISDLNDKIDTIHKSKLQIEIENIKLKEELSKIMGDKNCLNKKLRTLKDEKDELKRDKISLESEKAELITQNDTSNKFKTENEALLSRLSSYEAEHLQAKTELAKMKEVGKLQENNIHNLQKDNQQWRKKLEESEEKNSILQSRLGEAIERIELFEKEMSECLKNQKQESDKFLDIGVESFLQAPVEDMNITKLDDIDSDKLDQLDSPRRNKQEEQLEENVEGDGRLEVNVNEEAVQTNKSICAVISDIAKAASSSTRSGNLMEINTNNEHGDLIEIDASSNKVNDDINLKVNDVTVGGTEETEMPSNVEEQSKQKASLDNMKVKIFNCAKEEHIKEKVKVLMNDLTEADSKRNDCESDDLPKPPKGVTLDSTEKQIGSKLSKSRSKRKRKVKSYSEKTSDESDHSEVEEYFKKQANKPITKNANNTSKTSNKEKRSKQNKSTSSKEMISKSSIKAAKPTGNKAIDKTISCYKCGIKCKTKTELRNHILTHFYPDLFAFLPASKPFTCPTCSALYRDKTSLVRHFAFLHKEIYKYCTEEQLTGETAKGNRKSVYCEISSSKGDSVEGVKRKGFRQSTESWLSSTNKKFNKNGDDSDDGDLFAVKSVDDLSETDSKTKSVSSLGQEGSYPPENIKEKFLGMDDNGPADVDDLLQESQESDDGNV